MCGFHGDTPEDRWLLTLAGEGPIFKSSLLQAVPNQGTGSGHPDQLSLFGPLGHGAALGRRWDWFLIG